MPRAKTLGELVDEGAPTPLAFHLLVQLCEQRGWIPVGYRRIELPDGFAVTFNGTPEPRTDDEGAEIPPFHVSASRNGWHGGIFTMVGGVLLGGIEDALIAAIRNELAGEQTHAPTR